MRGSLRRNHRVIPKGNYDIYVMNAGVPSMWPPREAWIPSSPLTARGFTIPRATILPRLHFGKDRSP